MAIGYDDPVDVAALQEAMRLLLARHLKSGVKPVVIASGSASATVSIAFPTPFETTPVFTPTIRSHNAYTSTHSVTTSAVELTVYRPAGASTSSEVTVTVSWSATDMENV